MKIFLKVTQLTIASVLVFYAIHYFAKPQPKTMSKEWQEASNEYARVCLLSLDVEMIPLAASESLGFLRTMSIELDRDMLTYVFSNSPRRSTPSTASARRATRARASSRAPLSRSHKWARCPIGDEQDSDIGVGRSGFSVSQTHPDSGIHSPGHGFYVARHVVDDLTATGCPIDTDLSCLSYFVLWPTSIQKCVYPVLCYSQCISFVAIEKQVGPFLSFY